MGRSWSRHPGRKEAPDTEFVEFIKLRECEYDVEMNDTPVDHRLTPEKLMTEAYNVYNKCKDKGLWMALSPEQEQIIALSAEVKTLKQSLDKVKKDNTSDKKSSSSKGKNKKERHKRRAVTRRRTTRNPTGCSLLQWMIKKTKTVDSKEYHWCPMHKAWGIHTAIGMQEEEGKWKQRRISSTLPSVCP